MLFTFPSQYSYAIGLTRVFSLTGWSRRIRAEFLVFRVTQDTTRPEQDSCKGLSPAMVCLSRQFHSPLPYHDVVLQPLRGVATTQVWALPRSLPTTGGIIVYFLFLRVLRCFSSPRWPLHKQMSCLQHDGLSHSEIGGSKVICTYPPLIAAYHVLHRLSEPRHPPSALIYFLTIVDRTNKFIRLSFAHTFSFLFVVRSLELLFYSLACVNMSKIFSGTCPGVENNGFEPLTPCLQSRCSSQLS